MVGRGEPQGQVITSLVFDFGGVLIEWNPAHLFRKLFRGDEAAMKRFFNEVDFSAWNLQMDGGLPFSDGVATLIQRFPQYRSLIEAFDERWEETVPGPMADTVALLPALVHKGFKLYGLSNWSAEKFQLVRPKYEFFNLFDQIILSGEEKVVKPDPRIFERLLQKTGQRAQDCLFIDDSEGNIKAAEALGFQGVHFRSAGQLKEELQRRAIL